MLIFDWKQTIYICILPVSATVYVTFFLLLDCMSQTRLSKTNHTYLSTDAVLLCPVCALGGSDNVFVPDIFPEEQRILSLFLMCCWRANIWCDDEVSPVDDIELWCWWCDISADAVDDTWLNLDADESRPTVLAEEGLRCRWGNVGEAEKFIYQGSSYLYQR